MPAGREDLGRAVLELVTDPTKLRQGLAAARAESLQTVGGIQKSLTSIGDSMTRTGRSLTTGVTLPVIALGAAVTKIGSNFEETTNQIVGLTTVTRDQIDGIRADLVALGKEVGKTPQELAEAFYFVASAGFEADDAMKVLRASAQASAAGLGVTADIAKVLGLVLNAYGKENITAARAADILVASVRDGTAEASAFASVLGRIVPTAATLGVSFDQVAGALASMTLVGLSADEAATSLNQVFVSLLKPTSQAEQAMTDLGLSAAGLRRQLREEGLLSVLRTLEERFAGNDEAAGLVFGNVRALRGVLALLALDSEQLNTVFADTAAAQGDLAEAYSDTEGSAREFGRAQAQLHAALIELGEDVLPIVVDLVRQTASAVGDAVGWFKQLPQPVRETVIQGLALVAVLGPLLLVLGALAKGLAGLIGAFKLIALTWIPALVAGVAKLALTGAFFVQLGGAGAAAQAAALGFKAMGLAAVAATPLLLGLAAALGAVLFVWGQVRADIAAQAAQIGQDVQNTISRGMRDELERTKAALERGLVELDHAGDAAIGKLGPVAGTAAWLLAGPLSAEARAELERQLAAVNAVLDASNADLEARFTDGDDLLAAARAAWQQHFGAAAGTVRTFRELVGADLKATLDEQKAFARDMLASIQGFRTALEGAFGAAKDAELDMNDTLLAIAQKQAELAALDKETSAKIKNGTSVQSLEYRNRRLHILAELSTLKLHAALIGDDMHKQAALTSLLTGEDMAEGLTSPLPEVVAAYERLRDESLLALAELAAKGGPAGKAATAALARIFNPANTESPFYGMQGWGTAAIQAWLKGLISGLQGAKAKIITNLHQAADPFEAHSPPGPDSPLHLIDVWGVRTGQAWIGGLVASIRDGLGALRAPLLALADPFRAMQLPALTLAAGAAGAGMPGAAAGPRAALGAAGVSIGSISISVDASGAKDPAAVGSAVRQGVADAMADILREQSQSFVAGRS